MILMKSIIQQPEQFS